MLIFIVPVKSAQISTSWELASKLFERCVKSICNQTSSEFRVIVVCHERPHIEFNHPYIKYIEVSFPIPNWERTSDLGSRDRDKSRKIFTGLIYARQLKPCHVMFVDADDCVSNHLAEFVNQNSQGNGWFLNRGYEYQEGNNFIYWRKKDFHRKCGTSNIVRHDLIAPPESVKLESIDWDFLYHQDIVEAMKKRGTPLDELPFEGAIYVQENGENICNQSQVLKEMLHFNPKEIILFYARRAYKSFTSKRLTKSIRDEFGL